MRQKEKEQIVLKKSFCVRLKCDLNVMEFFCFFFWQAPSWKMNGKMVQIK